MQVLGPGASQLDVYTRAVRPVVDDVLAGYNGAVLAYGQTGAGKTHTLSNLAPEAIGMIPRAAADVFARIAANPMHEYTVLFSYIQIYMEKIMVRRSAFWLWSNRGELRWDDPTLIPV